jgi:uncharacterized protein YdhG (YjbR/CyaY superfamily)
MAKPRTVKAYLGRLRPQQRAALGRLRRDILTAAPGAEDCISYQIPALRYRGKVIVWYGAWKDHCSFFPGGIVARFRRELKGFEIAKGTIHFHPDHPIPARLVKKIVKAAIARLPRAARTAKR